MHEAARQWCVAFIGECSKLVALSRRRGCMDTTSNRRVLLEIWLETVEIGVGEEGKITWAWLELDKAAAYQHAARLPTEVQSEAVKLPGNRLAHALRYPESKELWRQRLQPGGSAPFTASPTTRFRG